MARGVTDVSVGQDTVGIGLAIGLSTFIGTLIGEISAGPVSDRLVYLHAKAHNGDINPESRLYATIPGAILIPIGVIIEGLCFQFKTHYMGPVMGIAIAAVGLQIVTTNIYAYITDVSLPSHYLDPRRVLTGPLYAVLQAPIG